MTVRWTAVVATGIGYGCLLAAAVLAGQGLIAAGPRTHGAAATPFLLVPLAISLAVLSIERRSTRPVPVRSLGAGVLTALLGGAAIGLATLLAGETGGAAVTPIRFALDAALAHGGLGAMEAVVVVGFFLAGQSESLRAANAIDVEPLRDERQRAA